MKLRHSTSSKGFFMSEFEFKPQQLQKQWLKYYKSRNLQVADFKREGRSWKWIADLMGLSREYVKNLGHKQGVAGPQRNFKVPDRKCPMCGQTVILKIVGKARGLNQLNGSVTRGGEIRPS